ncbi:hypothetical protein A9Q87_12170 [Flavobacteriales bacterium 34_180_T64]|nr:hypothetical protein A9Q87_12170 [Flavobacteriales bacterium 34_180_T64]
MTEQSIKEGKTLAVVSYFTLVGTLVAFFLNKDKGNTFAAFHIRQALGLWLLQMVLGFVVSGFDSWMVTNAFWIFFVILFIYGILGAFSGKQNSVPILGDFFQKIFATLK